jgi:hypothetical protein
MSSASVTAAHRDCVLFVVSFHEYDRPPESFVYRARAAGGATMPPRPPSLFLVPPCYHGVKKGSERHLYLRLQRDPWPRCLDKSATGLTRRGEDDLVVAFLGEVAVSDDDDKSAELLLLRHGEWTVKRPAIIVGEGKHGKKLRRLSSWESHKVVSVGDDGLMCWVNFRRGLMFSNVFDDTPTLRYVPLPRAEEVDRRKCWRRRFSQDLCVTSDGMVKLVRVSPRCCCGGAGATHCWHSKNAYTIKTWTLDMDDMDWVMDGMVDATELWALDAYKFLPRIQLACPTVSLDEPHVIFFRISESFYVWKNADKTEWVIEVDMRSKVIRSVCRYEEGRGRFRETIPTRVSDYFNSSTRCSDSTSSSARRGTMDVYSETSPLVIATEQLKENGSDDYTAGSAEEMILDTLHQIPGLAREHILKSYSLLTCDSNGSRRLKSLLGLPTNMRKDWLLMEIKSNEACSRISSCLLCMHGKLAAA